MNETAKRRLRTTRFALSVYWLTMFIGSHMPRAPIESTTQIDKVVHFAAFAVLTFFMAFYRGQLGRMTRTAYLTIFCIAAVYGAFDERTQTFVQGRTADPLDWVADLAGALVGLVLYWQYAQKFGKSIVR